MPRPPNKHTCVCGFDTPYWANLLAHRRQCDSWLEHKRGLQDTRHLSPRPPDPPGLWACPHPDCDVERDGPDSLATHIKYCPEMKGAAELADLYYSTGLCSVAEDCDSFAAYEAWCRENGREP